MSWTQAELKEVIDEFKKDLATYKASYDVIIRRIRKVEGTLHQDRFTTTSGCQAVGHVLVMNISRTEGILENLEEEFKKRFPSETLEDPAPPTAPVLKLVKEP